MIPIPSEQLYHPVRVCDDCFRILDAKQKPNHWTEIEPDEKNEESQQETDIVDDSKQETEVEQTDEDQASISGQQTPPPP